MELIEMGAAILLALASALVIWAIREWDVVAGGLPADSAAAPRSEEAPARRAA